MTASIPDRIAREDIAVQAAFTAGPATRKINHGRGADKAKRLAMSGYRRKHCAQCGDTFKPVKSGQNFCTEPCRKFYFNLRQRYGARIFELAIAWRKRREKGAFTAFTAQLDAILRDHAGELGHAITP